MLELRAQRVGVGDGRRREAVETGGRQRVRGVLAVRQQRLAEGGRVRGQERADVERLPAVVRPEDVVDDQHATFMERADADALIAAGGERVGPVQCARAQLVAVEVARAHVQQRGAELILARLRILLDEPDVAQGPQDPVDCGLRKPELAGDLDHADAARTPGQQPQNRGSTLDRLDPPRHVLRLDLYRRRGRSGPAAM